MCFDRRIIIFRKKYGILPLSPPSLYYTSALTNVKSWISVNSIAWLPLNGFYLRWKQMELSHLFLFLSILIYTFIIVNFLFEKVWVYLTLCIITSESYFFYWKLKYPTLYLTFTFISLHNFWKTSQFCKVSIVFNRKSPKLV